jgi:uncharacterized protein
MPEMKTYKRGMFNWVDLATTDLTAARRFYGELFGWSFVEVPMGGGGVYLMAQVRGKDVAGLGQQGPEERSQGIPPHWNSYSWVEDLEATAKQVEPLGGKLVAPPFDVLDAGRMCVVQDPSGAMLCLWEERKHKGAGLLGEPGALCWVELNTRDLAAARAFYTKLLGWGTKVGSMGPSEYVEFDVGGQAVGGMMELDPQAGNVPPHWMPYLTVEDCDRSTERARGLGANVLVPPQDIPHVGRFSILQDPQGATLAIIRLDLRA